jgi:hypothetical protein
MWKRETPLSPEVVAELDALDAALAGADDVDAELSLLVAAVAADKPALDAGARERLDRRVADAARREADRTPAASADGRTSPDAADPPPASGGRPPTARRPSGGLLARWRGPASWKPAVALVVAAAVAVPAIVLLGDRDGGSDTQSMALSDGAPSTSDRSATTESPTQESRAGELYASPGGDAEGAAGASAAAPSVAPQAGQRSDLSARVVPPSGGATSGELKSRDRQVVRDVEQTVRVGRRDVGRATDRITRIVQDAGGYVGSSEVRERASRPSATFQLVVPTARLDATVGELSRIGELVRLERRNEDVTQRAASLDDQLQDRRADRSSLRLQLARAESASRRAALRRELRLLTNEIAGLEAQRRSLRQQTDSARIALRVTTATTDEAVLPPPADDGRWGIGDALSDAGRIAEVAGAVLLLVGVLLVPLGLLGGLGWRLHRRRRALVADRAIDAA